jgi:RNA polymerase sigma-70 factor, ECF subfamily
LVKAPTDEQLLADHIAGRPDTFAVLVRRYSDELFRFLARFMGDSALAEDLVQEAFLQVYQSAGGFDLSRRFKPWLFTIAANKARDMMRSRRRRPEVPLNAQVDGGQGQGQTFLDFLADDSGDPLLAVEQSELETIVRGVLAGLPSHLREVLVLSYYNRFAYKELAETLEIPLGTVKSRLHAAVGAFARAYKLAVKERGER